MENQTISGLSLFDYTPVPVKDKCILVTGGTTGIGRAAALMLAAQGARVMILGRSQESLDEALGDFRQAGLEQQVHGLTADTSEADSIRQIFEAVDQHFGRLDILINNAALAFQGIMDGVYDDWEYIVKTNLLGYMACAHEAIRRMKGPGKGHIVNIGSMSADVREKDSSVYVAAKAGIQGFSESLRKEVNELGIKVTLIEPGAVGTDMQPSSVEEQQQKEAQLKMLKAEDIAMCVLYVLTQPQRCDVVSIQVRPHLQVI
jgi:NADP-dependent 3-hydroxy acid dehydrogenase YdfG